LNSGKAKLLREMAEGRSDVHVHEGDCNEVLLKQVFPRVRYLDYRRALCLLDPYKMNLDWQVIEAAGKEKSIEIFLNFPIMDMNRNVLRHNRDSVRAGQEQRMNSFWGDGSWEAAAYQRQSDLFGGAVDEKSTNKALVEAFRQRLIKVAGFNFVPTPMPMRNSAGADVYYLFFASPNKTGAKIVGDIFKKYR
jgi:three-Cys-motif partner protein